MLINNIPITTYGAYLIGTPKVSNAPAAPSILLGRERSNFLFLGYELGVKTLECSVAITGTSYRDIQRKRSALRAALLGKLDLFFSCDGFYYFAVYSGEAETESESKSIALTRLRFLAVQHDALVTTTGTTVNCTSTVPKTDCRLTVTATASKTNFILGSVTFPSVASGNVLVADGINGRVTKNGVDVLATFTRLPQLVPGANTIIRSNGTLTVEYYPTHM